MLERIKDKIITVEQALALVKDGDQIVTGLGATEGKAFLSNIHTLHGKVKNVTINNCLPMASYEFFTNPEYVDTFQLDGWFYNPGMRKAHMNGNISFIPNHLHFAGKKRFDHIHVNIYVGLATYPDKHGYVSLSLSNTYEKEAIAKADIVILEINKKAPRVFGDLEMHVDDVDHFIEVDYDIPELPDVPPSEKDLIIGKYISNVGIL